MGDGEHEAALEQRQARGGKTRHRGVAVGAVAVEVQRRRAVARHAARVDDGDRHLGAVAGRGRQPLGHEARTIVAARNALLLPPAQFAAGQVVVVHRVRRRQRGVAQAQRVGGVFLVVAEAHRAGGFGEVDALFERRLARARRVAATAAPQQADLVDAADALLHRHEAVEHAEVDEVARVGRRHQHAPGGLRRVGLRGDDQAGVLVRVVGLDDEAVALVIHLVLVLHAPRRDHQRRPRRIVRGDETRFAGHMVPGGDDHIAPRSRAPNADEEARVLFLVDHPVLRNRRAEGVQAHLIGPPLFVHHGVEERRVVGRPHRIALRILDGFGEQLAGVQVLHAQREALGAAGVRAVRQQAAVVGGGQGAQAKVLGLPRQRRLVQDHLRLRGGAGRGVGVRRRPPRPNAVLPARFEAPLVVVAVLLDGHTGLVLFLPRLDLGKEIIHQRLARRHHRLEVVVFRPQVRQHIRVVHIGVALILQPVVGIFDGDAVDGLRPSAALSLRRCRRVAHRRATGHGHGEQCEVAAHRSNVNRAARVRAWRTHRRESPPNSFLSSASSANTPCVRTKDRPFGPQTQAAYTRTHAQTQPPGGSALCCAVTVSARNSCK